MSTKKIRFKVKVDGEKFQFVEAKNGFEAAKKASGATSLKKAKKELNDPAGYKITTYKNDDCSVEVIEG